MPAPSTTSFLLLQHLHDLGLRVHEALAAGDLEDVQTLLHRRGDALARLQEHPTPTPVPPAWNALAAAIAEQQEALLQHLRSLEQQLTETLGTVSQYHRAQRGYARPAAERRILRAEVRG